MLLKSRNIRIDEVVKYKHLSNGTVAYDFADYEDFKKFVLIDNDLLSKQFVKYSNDRVDTNKMSHRLLTKLALNGEPMLKGYKSTDVFEKTRKDIYSPNYISYTRYDKIIKEKCFDALKDFPEYDMSKSKFYGNTTIFTNPNYPLFTLTIDGVVVNNKGQKFILNTFRDDLKSWDKTGKFSKIFANDVQAVCLSHLTSSGCFPHHKGFYDAVMYEKFTGEKIDGIINVGVRRKNAFARVSGGDINDYSNDDEYIVQEVKFNDNTKPQVVQYINELLDRDIDNVRTVLYDNGLKENYDALNELEHELKNEKNFAKQMDNGIVL